MPTPIVILRLLACFTAQQADAEFRPQSRSHSDHIGQEVVVQYRWHPLYGRNAGRIQGERRASGEFVHVQRAQGVVTILPGLVTA